MRPAAQAWQRQACTAAKLAESPRGAGLAVCMLCRRGMWRRCGAGDPARSAWPREAADGADGSPPGDAPSSCGEDDGPPGLCAPTPAQVTLHWIGVGASGPCLSSCARCKGTALACRKSGLPPQERGALAHWRLGSPVLQRRSRGYCCRLLCLGAQWRRGPAADTGAAAPARRRLCLPATPTPAAHPPARHWPRRARRRCLSPPSSSGAGESWLFPEDLAPFTRRPLLVVVDSEHARAFRSLATRERSYPACCLMSPPAQPPDVRAAPARPATASAPAVAARRRPGYHKREPAAVSVSAPPPVLRAHAADPAARYVCVGAARSRYIGGELAAW
jgi:hypothetical protein